MPSSLIALSSDSQSAVKRGSRRRCARPASVRLAEPRRLSDLSRSSDARRPRPASSIWLFSRESSTRPVNRASCSTPWSVIPPPESLSLTRCGRPVETARSASVTETRSLARSAPMRFPAALNSSWPRRASMRSIVLANAESKCPAAVRGSPRPSLSPSWPESNRTGWSGTAAGAKTSWHVPFSPCVRQSFPSPQPSPGGEGESSNYSVHGSRMSRCVILAASASPTICCLAGSQVTGRFSRTAMFDN